MLPGALQAGGVAPVDGSATYTIPGAAVAPDQPVSRIVSSSHTGHSGGQASVILLSTYVYFYYLLAFADIHWYLLVFNYTLVFKDSYWRLLVITVIY